METKVPACRAQRVTRLALSIAIATACFMALSANAGTLTGGATEWTQIANNIQLVQSYVKQAETMKNTLESAAALKQQLQQLDPGTLSRLDGTSLNQINSMVQMSSDLDRVISSGNAAVEVLQRNMANGQAAGMTPQEYLQTMSRLADERGDAYMKGYQSDQQAIQDLNNSAHDIQVAAASAPAITSEVGGMQALLKQGTQMQTQLVAINGAMREANGLQKLQLADQAKAAAAESDRKKAAANDFEAVKQIQISMPDPTKIPLTKDKQ